MSKMCKLSDQCCAGKGLCVHEKMMVFAIAVMAPVAAFLALRWF
jgi:hypothetical protein